MLTEKDFDIKIKGIENIKTNYDEVIQQDLDFSYLKHWETDEFRRYFSNPYITSAMVAVYVIFKALKYNPGCNKLDISLGPYINTGIGEVFSPILPPDYKIYFSAREHAPTTTPTSRDGYLISNSFKLYQTLYDVLKVEVIDHIDAFINIVQPMFDLSDTDADILRFIFISDEHQSIVYRVVHSISGSSGYGAHHMIPSVIGVDTNILSEYMNSVSKLTRCGLVIMHRGLFIIPQVLATFIRYNDITEDNFINTLVKSVDISHLSYNDFKHIDNYDIVGKIIKNSLKNKQGANILFHGAPGTGKTELAKVYAKESDVSLYEIKPNDKRNKSNTSRISAIPFISNLLSIKSDNGNIMLIDEADEVLKSIGVSSDDSNKRIVTGIIDDTKGVNIWIMNSLRRMDYALLRRFDYVLEFKYMEMDVLLKLVKLICKNNEVKLPIGKVKNILGQYKYPISEIEKAIKTVKLIGGGLKTFETMLKNSIDVLDLVKEPIKPNVGDYYEDLVNTNQDMKLITKQVTSLKRYDFTMCLYGASGTGKSAYGKYIADKLNLPFIIKKGSDLLGKYVGDNEKNIANMFTEAMDTKSVLILDEADSFLRERNLANQRYEVSMTNELLTQMEGFDYPFICTTNLMKTIDRAALRRFIFKVEYKPFTKDQVHLAFKHFFNIKEVNIRDSGTITPGDFATVKKKAIILNKLHDVDWLVSQILEEQVHKDGFKRNPVGFN